MNAGTVSESPDDSQETGLTGPDAPAAGSCAVLNTDTFDTDTGMIQGVPLSAAEG